MNKELRFRWNPSEEDDENAIVVHSLPSSSSSNIISPWSDFMQLPPQPPQQSEEDPHLQQQFFLHQQKLQQEYDIVNFNVVQPTITLPSIEPVQLNFECHIPCQRDQVVTGDILIGRTSNPDTGEHNKRLKSAQTAAHNVSEKRRRDKFKKRIKTLQELLPDCDKRDTASVLDETVKQIRLLKFQAQWLQEQQYMPSTISPMIPTQTNVLGMVPYPAILQYPAAAAMIPQMQMMPFIRRPPPQLLPYSTASSSMATTPRIALPPNPRVPSTDQVIGN